MSTYIDRLATEVMECNEPAVCQAHYEAARCAENTQSDYSPAYRKHYWEKEAHAYLRAVLQWARAAGRTLCVAETLKVAARIAERAAAVAELAEVEARATEMNTLTGEAK